jgi:hypothetical protein
MAWCYAQIWNGLLLHITNCAPVEPFPLSSILRASGLFKNPVQNTVFETAEVVRVGGFKIAEEKLRVRVVHVHRHKKRLMRFFDASGHQVGPAHRSNLGIPSSFAEIQFEKNSHFLGASQFLGNSYGNLFLGWALCHWQFHQSA